MTVGEIVRYRRQLSAVTAHVLLPEPEHEAISVQA
jgi:hypothetical protein